MLAACYSFSREKRDMFNSTIQLFPCFHWQWVFPTLGSTAVECLMEYIRLTQGTVAPVCQQDYLTGCWQVPEVLNSKWIPHPGGLHHLAEKIPGLHCKWNEEELRGEKDTGNRSRLSHKPQHLHGGIAGTGSRWQQNTDCNPRAGKYGKGTWDKAFLFLIGFNYFPQEHQAAPLLGGQWGVGEHLRKQNSH